jgi:hypothetical protein
LHRHILDVFNEQYGVQIVTPAYESDTAQLKVVPRDQVVCGVRSFSGIDAA